MSNASPTAEPAHRRVLELAGVGRWWPWYLATSLAAALVPCLIVLVGAITKLLEDGQLYADGIAMGRYLRLPVPAWLLELDPLAQLGWLVGIALAVALLEVVFLYTHYRGLYLRARLVMRELHERVLETSIKVAEQEGVTAQRNRTGRLIEAELPLVQRGVIDRWRALPRSLVLTALCTALAVSVDVWLTLLALISGLIVWLVFRWLDEARQGRIGRYDLGEIRRRLVEAAQTAPILSRVRGDDVPVDESGGPLGQLMEATTAADAARVRVIPLVAALAMIFLAVLLLALGGNMLVDDSPVNLPAALVLCLSLVGAVVGALRIIRVWNRQGVFREACEMVVGFIDRADGERPGERMGLSGPQHGIELDNVTLHDGAGRPLLNRLSLRFEPASLVAMMGTDPLSLGAFADLIMGFGTPKSGQARIGNVPISDLHRRWLSQNVLWVGRSGPLWTGTINENFAFRGASPEPSEVAEAARRVGVYDRLQSLSDGFSTLIDADDGRLDEATRYGLALARAWLRRPPIVIVQEPPVPPGTLADDPGMNAMCALAEAGSLVIVLPQRLQTLRMTDRVILLNGGQLAGEGKHEQLLADSDLYRHLNYVLFNPYRRRNGTAGAF
jgi:ABC-type multidrug transport system fused ATPase/permease subunit